MTTVLLINYVHGTAFKVLVPDDVDDVEEYLFGCHSPFCESEFEWFILNKNDDIITIKDLHNWI